MILKKINKKQDRDLESTESIEIDRFLDLEAHLVDSRYCFREVDRFAQAIFDTNKIRRFFRAENFKGFIFYLFLVIVKWIFKFFFVIHLNKKKQYNI